MSPASINSASAFGVLVFVLVNSFPNVIVVGGDEVRRTLGLIRWLERTPHKGVCCGITAHEDSDLLFGRCWIGLGREKVYVQTQQILNNGRVSRFGVRPLNAHR